MYDKRTVRAENVKRTKEYVQYYKICRYISKYVNVK